MTLICELPKASLDIIGDIHGEIDALNSLLTHLGYDINGDHLEGRILVFVGDFCDRGPDSAAVIKCVERLVNSGKAFAVLGNHELNLLRNDAKDGSGWFFDSRTKSDSVNYEPFIRPSEAEKKQLVSFLLTLPLALEREDIRIVHAAWLENEIDKIRQMNSSDVLATYDFWDAKAKTYADSLKPLIEHELKSWAHGFENPNMRPPLLAAHADYNAALQMMNPVRIMTSGVERRTSDPFFSSGKWRLNERVTWWDEYQSEIPVVIGHYWRRFKSTSSSSSEHTGDIGMFDEIDFHEWHGNKGNVYCIDYSVGGRSAIRKSGGVDISNCKLSALQWPERRLIFDDGESIDTIKFLDHS